MLPEYTPAGILEVDKISFIEPSYSDLVDEHYTYLMTTIQADQGRLLIDEESDPLALAVLTSKGWIAGSFHLRSPTASLIEYFESLGGDIYQEDRDIWEQSVREYYSLIIKGTVVPALEDVNPDRVGMIESLLEEVWGDRSGAACLDRIDGSSETGFKTALVRYRRTPALPGIPHGQAPAGRDNVHRRDDRKQVSHPDRGWPWPDVWGIQ